LLEYSIGRLTIWVTFIFILSITNIIIYMTFLNPIA